MNKIKTTSRFLSLMLSLVMLFNCNVYASDNDNYIAYDRNHGSSGNFFDDYIDHDKDNDNKIDESDGNYTDDIGLAAGIQIKTSVYSDVALILASIALCMSACFLGMYLKRKRNHY